MAKNWPFAHFLPTFIFKSGQAETAAPQGLIVIRYYLALRGAENGVTAMVTPFFCVQGWISQQQARKSQESLHHPRS